ncbi:hypothetical protein [Bacillus sp. AFS040349]|uniref:hypothetical protein n=1 Tax=Bacillus sp. AFS040349 TaxID=2033502 RepID=UPI002100003A|nr:hypothetical protein [Bacillus sp. AFS040349]
MEIVEVTIPHCYLWMTEYIRDRDKRAELFNEYVKGYVQLHDPDLKLIRIEKMKAICERMKTDG